MKPTGDLIVYKNKGRPTNEQKEIMKCSKSLKKELLQLKKDLGYKEGTEILLALSVASDEMSRHVHMFPETLFLDTTANTNRQGRSLFLSVVKDSNGHAFPINATVIPSEKAWVFTYIYQNFFRDLYGDVTLNRIRLLLTDDDPAEHGPLDSSIATLDCYSNAINMLCGFHAVVLAYHEKVTPKLPHSAAHILSDDGELYGTSLYLIVIHD